MVSLLVLFPIRLCLAMFDMMFALCTLGKVDPKLRRMI